MNDILRDEQLDEELEHNQRQLQELREREQQLEKLREELATLADRQRRFMGGREKLREELRRAITRLESENYQLQRRLRLVGEMKKLLEPYPEAIEEMRPEHWNRERLDQELLDALAAVEQMEQDLKKAAAALGWDEPGADHGKEEPDSADFMLWFQRGLAFTLPLVAVLFLILLLNLIIG